MASILEDFLVRLGFNVDKASQKKFQDNLKSVRGMMSKVAKAGIAIGTAVGTGTIAAANNIGNLYNQANNIGTNITGIKALSQAFESVGGSADMATSVMGNLADNLKGDKIYAYAQNLKGLLGVDVWDDKGRIKDTSKLFEEIVRSMGRLSDTQAKQKAQILGLGDSFDYFRKNGFLEEITKMRNATEMFGTSLDENAVKAQRMSNSLSRVWETVKTSTQVGAIDLIDSLGLDKWLEDFGTKMSRWIPSVFDTIKEGFSWFSSGETSVKKEAVKYAERRTMDNALETDLSEEDDTPEVRAALENVREQRDNTKVLHERLGETFVKADDERFKKQEKALGKGNVKPTFETDSATEEKTRTISETPVQEKTIAIPETPVQESKEYGAEEDVTALFNRIDTALSTPKESPKPVDVSYTAKKDDKPSSLSYAEQPTAEKTVEKIKEASVVPVPTSIDNSRSQTNNRNDNSQHSNNKTNNVTVNQTITVNGATNPEEFARRMMQQTSNTSRDLQSNLY